MTTIPSPRRSILAAAIVSLAALSAAFTTQAATITWGGAQNITGDSDVSTTGTLVGALNIGDTGVANTTVNGTLFTGVVLSGSNVTSGDFNLATAGTFGGSNSLGGAAAPFNALTAPYQSLLGSGATSFTTGFTLTISGLVVGESYEFQWWSNASNAANAVQTTATAGNAVMLSTSPVAGVLGTVGQFAIGTFIADNAAQAITFTGPVQDIINGFQLRQTSAPTTAVPEPGSALIGAMVLGVCGLGSARRRRAVQ